MPKLRSAEEFSDYIQEDSAWRKKELADLLNAITRAPSERRSALLRAGVAIIYAHFEGFVKAAAAAYLQYISEGQHRDRIRRLHPHFRALSMWDRCQRAGTGHSEDALTMRCVEFLRVASEFLGVEDGGHKVAYKKVIAAESNLSSKVLSNILYVVKVEEEQFETKKTLIDEKLLAVRNKIVHGDRLPVDLDDYQRLHEEVMGMINLFSNQLQNAIELRAFEGGVRLRAA